MFDDTGGVLPVRMYIYIIIHGHKKRYRNRHTYICVCVCVNIVFNGFQVFSVQHHVCCCILFYVLEQKKPCHFELITPDGGVTLGTLW